MIKRGITFRRYCMVDDFHKVYDLCAKYGNIECSNGMCASFWEYAQTFGCFAYEFSHRIGLWEDNGKLVAVAAYEIALGEAYFIVDPMYLFLAEELIGYAEKQLGDGEGRLTLYFSDKQTEMKEAAVRAGFVMHSAYPEKVFLFSKGLPSYALPENFRFLQNGSEDVDFIKLDACLHYGFNHEGEPDGDTDFRIHMLVTPHFDPRLPVIVIDERTQEYAAFANSFIDEVGAYAYLEPLCTQPKYRNKGIAAAVLTEMMRRVTPLGATYLTGGSSEFYTAIGFEIAYYDESWVKKEQCATVGA